MAYKLISLVRSSFTRGPSHGASLTERRCYGFLNEAQPGPIGPQGSSSNRSQSSSEFLRNFLQGELTFFPWVFPEPRLAGREKGKKKKKKEKLRF